MFITKIDDRFVDIINYDGEDITASTKGITVTFEIGWETRSWGMKMISVYNIKIHSGTVILEKDNDPEPNTETEIDVKDFEVREEVKVDSDDITVHELEIDIKNKIITVT